MSWNDVLLELSPVLSSPNANQVPPTLMMPSPCICSGLPFWSVHAAPGENDAVAACAGIATTTIAAATTAVIITRRNTPVTIGPDSTDMTIDWHVSLQVSSVVRIGGEAFVDLPGGQPEVGQLVAVGRPPLAGGVLRVQRRHRGVRRLGQVQPEILVDRPHGSDRVGHQVLVVDVVEPGRIVPG